MLVGTHNGAATLEKVPRMLIIELPYDVAITYLGIDLKEIKAETCRDICSPMFITALFREPKGRSNQTLIQI